MTGEPTRPKFVTGKLLRAADLSLEQEYQLQLLELADRHLHEWGVADGLSVTAPAASVAGTMQLVVSPGLALDAGGREIILSAPVILDAGAFPALVAFVTIRYFEEPVLPISTGGTTRFRRVRSGAIVSMRDDPPEDPARELWLARVELSSSREILSIDETVRRATGYRAGTVRFPAGQSETKAAIAATSSPGSLALDAQKTDFFGSLSVTGGVGIATDGPPAAALEIARVPAVHAAGQAVIEGGRAYGRETYFSGQLRPGDMLVVEGLRLEIEEVEGAAMISAAGLGSLRRSLSPINFIPRVAARIALRDGSPALAVTAAGDVGVGTDEPEVKLHIANGDLAIESDHDLEFSGDGAITTRTRTTGIIFQPSRVPRSRLTVRDQGDLIFRTGSASEDQPTLAVTGARGWVGAGVRSPIDALAVDGIIEAEALIFPDGSIQSSSVVQIPVGTIVDWWRPDGSIDLGPEGFQICNGSTIDDPESPLQGTRTPDLRDKFIRGVIGFEDIGLTGGEEEHEHEVTLGRHDHSISHVHPIVTNFQVTPQKAGIDIFGSSLSVSGHLHTFQLDTNGASPSRSTIYDGQEQKPTSKSEALPQYMYLLKVMRVK